MLSATAAGNVPDLPIRGGQYIANAIVSDNAYAHFGDNIYNHYNVPDSRKRKLALLLESLTFTRMGARERNVAEPMADTCDWLFTDAQFCAWANGEGTQENHGFFWVRGKPGTGKSTLMKRAMGWAHAQWPDKVILSYFFNGRSLNELEQTICGVYRTLLHQLLSSLPALHDHFLATFAAKVHDDVEVDPWEEIELQNFLLQCIGSKYAKALIIFIDAMDEGHDDDVERMVFFLEQLATRAISMDAQLKLCLSSRHYPHIDLPHSISLVLEDEAGHDDDIETYIRNSLPSSLDSMDHLPRLILDRSQGIFLWVVLVMPVLKAAHRKGRGPNAILRALEGVPRDLHELFASLLSREPEGLDQCVTLLRWVLHAFESITPEMLCTAVLHTHSSTTCEDVISDGDHQQRYILNTSRGLVETIEEFSDSFESFSAADSDEEDAWLDDPNVQTIQFIHQTVIDYLLVASPLDSTLVDNEDVGLPHASFSAEFCHAKISRTCLEYLNLLSATTALTSETLKNWPLAPYAAKFWATHMKMSGSACDQSLVDLAARFLFDEKSRQVWIQLYDLDYPTDLSSTETSRWGRQVLKQSSIYHHRSGPLIFAARLELPQVVEAMTLVSPAIDARDEMWGDVLQVICSKKLWALVGRILDLGANPNTPIGLRHRGSPLQLASLCGNSTIVQLLLEHGANVSIESARLATPLQEAAKRGHHTVVQLLLDHGAQVNVTNAHLTTSLQEAAKYGHLGVVTKLILANADLNSGSLYGDNALIRAFEAGHDDVVRCLISAGATVGLEWEKKWPAVVQALVDGRAPVVRALMISGLPVHHEQFTAALLDTCQQKNQHKMTALFATAMVAFGNAWKAISEQALFEAVDKGYTTVVNSLLAMQVNANSTNSLVAGTRITVLMHASKTGREEIVTLLLDANADVNIGWGMGSDQDSAFVVAAKARHKGIAKILLQRNAKIHISDICQLRQNGLRTGVWPKGSANIQTYDGSWILGLIEDLDSSAASGILQGLFQEAVEFADVFNDTGPLELMTGNWLYGLDLRTTALRFVDQSMDEVICPVSDSDLCRRSIYLCPLWDIRVLGSELRTFRMGRALINAAYRGYEAAVQLLFAHGVQSCVDITYQPVPSCHPLYAAASGQNVEVVKLFIQRGAVLSQEQICILFQIHSSEGRSIVDRLSRAGLLDLDDETLRRMAGRSCSATEILIRRELFAALQRRSPH